MANQVIVSGVLMDEHTTLSWVEISDICHVSEDRVIALVEHGLLPLEAPLRRRSALDANMVSRIQTACRLQDDLDLNVSGVVLVLELLDELERTRSALRVLERHVQDI